MLGLSWKVCGFYIWNPSFLNVKVKLSVNQFVKLLPNVDSLLLSVPRFPSSSARSFILIWPPFSSMRSWSRWCRPLSGKLPSNSARRHRSHANWCSTRSTTRSSFHSFRRMGRGVVVQGTGGFIESIHLEYYRDSWESRSSVCLNIVSAWSIQTSWFHFFYAKKQMWLDLFMEDLIVPTEPCSTTSMLTF